MSDWPAPASSRQNTLKGCMGSLPQVFQWSRVLVSNNKCIVTPADTQMPSAAIEKQTQIKRWKKQTKLQHHDGLGKLAAVISNKSAIGSSNTWKVSDSNVPRDMVAMDLRQVLHAKQEPFVLQDVIRDKRQPTRTTSSRELKFEAPPPRRSAKMKDNRTTSKHQGHAAGNGYSAECQTQHSLAPQSPTDSAAVVKRNRFPVESMVAVPSYQATSVGVTKAHSKAASLGRSPVKSPNKKALLMEAAARILEGSANRRNSKRLSMSVRALSDDLDKSKHVKEQLKPMEKLLSAVALHSEATEREGGASPILVIPAERVAESTQHQNSHDLNCSSKHNSKTSCKNHFNMAQVVREDLLVMQKRVFPYDSAPDEAEDLPSLATPMQNPSSEKRSEHEQLHDDLCSRMKGIEGETVNQIVEGFRWTFPEASPQAKTGAIMLPEIKIMEDQSPEHDNISLLKECRAIVPSMSIDSSADFLPVMLMKTSPPNFDHKVPSLIRSVLDHSSASHFIRGYHAAALQPVDSPEGGEVSSARTTRRILVEGADETVYADILREKFAQMQSSFVQLRLCNYSWWASCQDNSPKIQLSTEYSTECDSPDAAATCLYFGKTWNDDIIEEEASSHVCPIDEFEQASPVSVLEPVYEEDFESTDSFDNFEEARQKLLEKVSQYEMLAHMDVDTLQRVSEEHSSYAWDDYESWEIDHNYSCSSSYGGASDSSAQASPVHYFPIRDMETRVSRECFVRDPHSFLPEDQSLYGQEMNLRPSSSLDCSTEKLELRPISCRALQSQRVRVSGDDHILQVAGNPSCFSHRSIVACMVNSPLHNDLATSNWSSSKEDEEEVQLELESCFFEVLMCEVISDLLKAQFKPFCNAFDMENPVHNAELSNVLQITT